MNKKLFSFQTTDATQARLSELKQASGRSMAAIIIIAVRYFYHEWISGRIQFEDNNV